MLKSKTQEFFFKRRADVLAIYVGVAWLLFTIFVLDNIHWGYALLFIHFSWVTMYLYHAFEDYKAELNDVNYPHQVLMVLLILMFIAPVIYITDMYHMLRRLIKWKKKKHRNELII